MASPQESASSCESEKVSRMKAEFQEWGTKTTIGVFAGMIYGGCKEAIGFSGNEQTLLLKHSAMEDQRQRRMLLREIFEQRVLRVAKGTVLGGAKLGLFTALFCGIQHTLAVERNVHDSINVAAAGSVTAGVFGLMLPGSFLHRVRTAVLGSVLGATFCLPLGYLYSSVQDFIEKNEQKGAEISEIETERKIVGEHDAVRDAIQRLEDRLSRK